MGYISIIDLGTGSIRNSIFDTDGQIVTFRYKKNDIIHPQPGWAEQNPWLWWELLKETFLELPSQIRLKIGAISVTSQREGLVPVDEHFNPLSNIIIWLDGRTLAEGKQIEDQLGTNSIYDITGLVPNPAWSLAKLLWIRKNQNEVYDKTYKFLQAEDYLISRFSGKAASEFSIASRTCMLDVKKREWSKEILAAFDIPIPLLPQLFEPGSLLGVIHEAAAREFGLPASVQIFTGAGDQQAAAVGVGAFSEGWVSIGIGTSSALSMTLNTAKPDPEHRIILNCAALAGKWEYEPPIWNTGGLIKWYIDNVEARKTKYDVLLNETNALPPGADGVMALPYFSGAGSPRWNPTLKGGFYGLTLSHGKIHLLKALMESVAYEIKHNLLLMEKQGVVLQKIILSGGASKNRPLCQVIADVLQVEVDVYTESEASSRGTYLMVKSALEKKPVKSVFESIGTKTKNISPDHKKADTYLECFENYVRLGDLLTKY